MCMRAEPLHAVTPPPVTMDTAGYGIPTLAMDGAVLLFAGTYGNPEATLAMRAAAARLGIAPGNAFYTGDVVAHGADPVEAVAAVRDRVIHVVMSNCEEALGWSREDRGCAGCPRAMRRRWRRGCGPVAISCRRGRLV